MPVNKIQITLMTGLLCFFSNVVHAEYDAANLKKLFTDKDQRAHIDAIRSGNPTSGEVRQSSKINVNGYVTRSDGKSVVWVNNKNTLESSKLDDVNVQQSSIGKNKQVTVSVDGKRKQLKPGETWHKESGKVVDSQ
ncbi:hypothetical protein MNBD_GAMMA06-1146 [hydrothermal vent metagenome]|uniref:Uncharacterized protein n=1 Tax=hydrothermal vent metagenome TaxID=652676 RepID=A0A3B0W9H9_9ZZZZ